MTCNKDQPHFSPRMASGGVGGRLVQSVTSSCTYCMTVPVGRSMNINKLADYMLQMVTSHVSSNAAIQCDSMVTAPRK